MYPHVCFCSWKATCFCRAYLFAQRVRCINTEHAKVIWSVWCGARVARVNGEVIQLAYLLTHSELIKAGESRCKEVNRALAGKRFAMLRDPSAESNLYLCF